MLTKARLEEDVVPAELDFITALRAPSIKALVEAGAIQLSLFDQVDLVEVTHPDYPGERLVPCKNPYLAEERTRKRLELLAATGAELEKIATAVTRERRPLRGKDKIALAVGKVINARKMAKHFVIEITEDSFSYRRDEDKIAAEAALDGIYVLRTSVEQSILARDEVVSSYKALAYVERIFRGFNTDLDIRPIRHRSEERVRECVRAHALLLRQLPHGALARPLLFKDDDHEAAEAQRTSPVAPALRSAAALKKRGTKRTQDHAPVRSLLLCWRTWPPLQPTGSSRSRLMCPPSPSSPHASRSNAGPSICSVSHIASASCSQYFRLSLIRKTKSKAELTKPAGELRAKILGYAHRSLARSPKWRRKAGTLRSRNGVA